MCTAFYKLLPEIEAFATAKGARGEVFLDAFAGTVREVVAVSNLPVIVDADTGFGEAEMARTQRELNKSKSKPQVTRTVREYIAAGAAGLHIEDQAPSLDYGSARAFARETLVLAANHRKQAP